jgi:hypothetical protein
MKAEWTPTGGSTATLGDDSVKHSIVLEDFGGQSLEQVVQLPRAASVARYARGNVAGVLVLVAAKSHADRATMMAAWKTEYARLNTKGELVLTEGITTWTMALATLVGVTRADCAGVRLAIRYRFNITTIT